ncbi:hypothetical protein J2129_001321 [Methanofollis sp. W23]|uniref:transposase family protein n=1 Tax=Methanofollis sp. W23 TaxID=2817849 RepID=UPI001AE21BEB|nr:transposase family protein [Methanofollis sp. W23]MBP2145867.1 hypothetical protein [Methanofollis sp. W23]
MQVPVPPMLADLVATSFSALDGVEFSDLSSCPECGGEVRGHDMKKRRFAVIKTAKGRTEISVWVRRYYCTRCRALCSAPAPFYPDTRVGAPVVDLCRVFAREYSFSRAARVLAAMGIVLDRGSVRNYAALELGSIPSIELWGLHLPGSLLSLISLTIGRSQVTPVPGAEVLAACGLPAADRAPLHLPRSPSKEGDERDEEEENEKRES